MDRSLQPNRGNNSTEGDNRCLMTLMSRNKHNPTEEDKFCLLTLTTEQYVFVYTAIFKVQHFIYNVDVKQNLVLEL